MKTTRFAAIAILLLGLTTVATAGFLRPSTVPMTVLTVMSDDGNKRPAVSPEAPAYYVLQSGAYHETGWRAPNNELTRADLDPLLQAALGKRGYQPADDRHAPALAVVYHWGAHNLPDTGHPRLGEDLLYRNVLERAALAGGKAFASGLRAALLEAAAAAQTNAQGLAGTGGPAAIAVARMAGLSDPVARFRERTEANRFLYDQATADCFFLIVSAYDFDPATGRRGGLLWRTSATVQANRLTQRQAHTLLMLEASSCYGRPMDEPATIRPSITGVTASLAAVTPKK